jgi:hypothetical protein
MRLIYIAGTAHSGSTLLDLMLNAHPDIVSVGEVLKLNRRTKRKRSGREKFTLCSCGAPISQCEFWARVDARIREADGRRLDELELQDHQVNDSSRTDNSVLFKGISHVSGKNVVVDSSKLPQRLAQLMSLDEIDVYPIHLVRDPKGQLASVIDQWGLFRGIVNYEVVHLHIRRLLKQVPHSVVRYEELVRNPKVTLDAILKPLGLRFHPRQLDWADQAKHSVAGNHLRMKTTSELVLDERWKQRLSRLQRLTIECGTLVSRSLRA